ncbi:MAG TPA: hypothetical protein VFR90_07880 [Methylibium sp.]|uniref:hypothetical protein n=1 Tax=Methylibium sp. TaxID=2067992 RepID=UPI002DBB4BB6|nr:hypothetical protein [Methylibium sp.]HEU4459025.1 hypothetical protein [Methylibium sp.]
MAQLKPATELAGITNLSVLATVKAGLVEHSFQRVSHAKRLELVLGVLSALRRGQRESLRDAAVLPDPIGRLETIHEFRFSIVAPTLPGEPTRFLLSVSFDGGWEPYMRFIWRDLGTLLDLMFCHCEGYPLAAASSYADYIAWVRRFEIGAKDAPAFYYVDAPVTVGDQRTLPAGRPVTKPAPSLREQAVAALKPIAALHALNALFTGADAPILLRAAHDIVPGVRAGRVTQLGLAAGDPARLVAGAALEWFEQPPLARPSLPPPRGGLQSADLQGGILRGYAPLTDGVLLLLRVTDRARAVATLRSFPVTPEQDAPAAGPWRNLAFTHAGLRALGEPESQLALFPQEFVQGMEARCGVLGDLRGNHPTQWLRPKLQGSTTRLELSLVHAVLQLRANFPQRRLDDDGVHVDFAPVVETLLPPGCGLQVLAREPMLRLPRPEHHPAAAHLMVDQLGFADGLSQPQLGAHEAPPQHWNDQVQPGEIFLGHPNDRGDGPYPGCANALLDHGSFLVVRKLRQHVRTMLERLGEQAATIGVAPDALLEAAIGRRRSGAALAAPVGAAGTNDFNFAGDANGARCPLQSHVRRANPRDGTQATPSAALHPAPRILRRGMSYGARMNEQQPDDADRGIVFMAYCASIAEQFEVLQRWLAGGNSTHLPSTDADPLLGVPQQGRPREFACVDAQGRPVRIDLGPDPFVSLQWGLYLFVPSLPALRGIGRIEPTAPSLAAKPRRLPKDFGHWQQRLESLDPLERAAAWKDVAEQPKGVLATDYGVLVAQPKAVCELLRDRDGHLSVEGYAERMGRSIGLNHLGMDEPEHAAVAPGINAALASIDEPAAFDAAHPLAQALIDRGAWPQEPDASGTRRLITIDTAVLADRLLAQLSTLWFDLPDGRHVAAGSWRADLDAPPRCPGDALSASRYVFGPHPSASIAGYGERHGDGLRRAALAYLKEHGRFDAPVSSKVEAAVRLRAGARDKDEVDEEVARTVVGSLFGFTPTVYGNARAVLGVWLRDTKFWELQLELAALPDAAARRSRLRAALQDTMLGLPVPDMLWRRAKRQHSIAGVRVAEGATVVIGLLAASRQLAQAGRADPALMFGGEYRVPPPDGGPVHPCPGRAMAMGVLTGLMLALLEAGTLRRGLASGHVVLERP